MEIENYKSFVRSFGYMSNIERSINRQAITQEYFTPLELVEEILDRVEYAKENIFSEALNKLIDNSCGDGQFLSEIVIRKMERSGCSLEQALSTTYGVDIMPDNVELCKKRLAGPAPTEEIHRILERNIVCSDALTYHYRFDGTAPDVTDDQLKANEFFDF